MDHRRSAQGRRCSPDLPGAGHGPRIGAARWGARLGAATLLAGGVLAPTPAHAAGSPTVNIDGVHEPLGTVNIILIFGVIPAALTALLALIFLRPSTAPGAQRYRPGRGWDAAPVWFGLDRPEPPTEPHPGAGSARPALPGPGGTDRPDRPEPAEPLVGDVLDRPSGLGGARGSW